jgi:hydroxylaminobenzene mutase
MAQPVPADSPDPRDAASPRADLRRSLSQWGAVLFFVGILTGLWSAACLTGTAKVPIPHLALAAHLNGLLGGLWMIAVAFTFDYLHYELRGLRWLSLSVGLACWANWAVTAVASLLGVTGLAYTSDMANNAIAFLLQISVVIPGLVGSGLWAWGFRRPQR